MGGLVTEGSIFGIGGHCGARCLDITFDAHSSALVHTGRAVAANFDEFQAETGQLVAVGDVPYLGSPAFMPAKPNATRRAPGRSLDGPTFSSPAGINGPA